MKTLKQALEAYRKGDFKRNEPMAKFCKVRYETALEWGRIRNPGGETLNKLWHFLDAYGFRVAETGSLDPAVYYLGQLIAFDVITPEEAMELLGLDGPSMYIWRVLQGKIIPASIRKGIITETTLIGQYGNTLRQAQMQKHQLGLVPTPSEEGSLPATIPTDGSHITVTAAFINALSPLLKRVNSEGETSVKALRAALDDDTFYEVLDGLKAMSSRRARQFYHGPKER